MIIFYNFRCELTQQQCIDELSSSRTSVYRWYGKFNRGRNSLQDQFREGRPKLVVVPEAIDTVRQLLLQDRHVTYRKIETILGINGTSIHSIFHEHLFVKNFVRVGPHTISQSLKNINQSE